MDQKIKHTSLYGGEYELSVSFGKYANGQTRIQLVDTTDGIPYATATVAVEEHLIKEGEVAIKDYSENEGILSSLVEAGIVENPHNFIQSGYVKIPICKLK
jgi:hypothetical protein